MPCHLLSSSPSHRPFVTSSSPFVISSVPPDRREGEEEDKWRKTERRRGKGRERTGGDETRPESSILEDSFYLSVSPLFGSSPHLIPSSPRVPSHFGFRPSSAPSAHYVPSGHQGWLKPSWTIPFVRWRLRAAKVNGMRRGWTEWMTRGYGPPYSHSLPRPSERSDRREWSVTRDGSKVGRDTVQMACR